MPSTEPITWDNTSLADLDERLANTPPAPDDMSLRDRLNVWVRTRTSNVDPITHRYRRVPPRPLRVGDRVNMGDPQRPNGSLIVRTPGRGLYFAGGGRVYRSVAEGGDRDSVVEGPLQRRYNEWVTSMWYRSNCNPRFPLKQVRR